MINKVNNIFNSRFNKLILFSLSFIIWIVCFRGFVFDKLSLTSDALAYFEHFKFFTDALEQGIYPLWDSSKHSGLPVEFFLRRIGSFNLLFFLIIILKKIGLPYRLAYLFFLSFYYFLGLIGFFVIANRIFKNFFIAFTAFLLLMFSSLGTRLFDSYIILTVTPLIWFFCFLILFTQDPKKHTLLGMTFTLMILLTTYIPFYFINILLSFLICFSLFYFNQLQQILKRSLVFFNKKKIFTFMCLICFLFSLMPGILFYIEGGKGEIVIPKRGVKHEEMRDHMVKVDIDTIEDWGVVEDIGYSVASPDYRDFNFAIVYVPNFIFIILLLGLLSKINKRLVFYMVWGIGLFLITSPHAQIYRFLYEHIFYFKYFRNLHFFVWLILLPVFILFTCEQLRLFMDKKERVFGKRFHTLIYIFVIHFGFLGYEYFQGMAIVTTYLVIGLSLGFFILQELNYLKNRKIISYFILILIILQPIEVFHYLNVNSPKSAQVYPYESNYLMLNILTRSEMEDAPNLNRVIDLKEDATSKRSISMYMGLKWFQTLIDHIDYDVYNNYTISKLWFYDHVEKEKKDGSDFARIESAWNKRQNVAFVPSHYDGLLHNESKNPPVNAQIVLKDLNQLEVGDFSYNYVTFKTNLKNKKFLVYLDGYHSGWHAYIDNEEVPLWRANIAFKGIWIPAGEHVVHLRFGHWWQYLLNWSLLILFYGLFIYFIFLTVKNYQLSIK